MAQPPKSWDRPYVVHTGRELELMLAGKKPLAHFYHTHPEELCEEIIPLTAFAPYVEQGRFIMRQYVELLRDPPPKGHEHVRGTLNVFYSLPFEEWRIDAYILMKAISASTGWSEGFERMQGALLGYSEAECDAHMEAVRSSPVSRNWYWVRPR